MPWRRKEPGHQQPWYWQCKINGSLSSMRKDFNYLHHLSMEKWQKIPVYFSLLTEILFWNKSSTVRVNTLRPRQHGRHFADDSFKRIFLNENVIISIKISLKFVPKGPINNIPALVQIMAWRRPGDKPLSEAMMVSLLTHICITRPQWVKSQSYCVPQAFCCNIRGCIRA